MSDQTCPNCGATVGEDDNSCMECGQILATTETQSPVRKFIAQIIPEQEVPANKGAGCAKAGLIMSIIAICLSGFGYLLFSKSTDTLGNADSALSLGAGLLGWGGSSFLWTFGIFIGLIGMVFAVAAIVRSPRMMLKGVISIVIATVAYMLPSFYSAIIL